MDLPPGWYAFGSPSELSRRGPIPVRRFGLDLVVWRTGAGEWVVQADRCPHRSARLSLGRVDGETIRCPFHGFRFDGRGSCTYVPEIDRDAPGLRVETFPAIERHGFVWMAWRNPAQAEPPWFPELDSPRFTFAERKHVWDTHFSRCVENQLDYAHLPFVHANSIGRGFDPNRTVGWELTEQALKAVLEAGNPDAGFFEFRFPNIWRLAISPRLVQVLFFVPVDDGQTAIYERSYHGFTRLPIVRNIVAALSTMLNRYILSQDHRVVIGQRPRNVRDADEERLFPGDKAIAAFRTWLRGPE
jgi:phenylpropionate dioxygenase-like ring-hydroxylating dioxygenase large terminal subunit